jgi:hypothetical protein
MGYHVVSLIHTPRVLVILTEGSRSTKMERGTHFPVLVSEKKVSNDPVSQTMFEQVPKKMSIYQNLRLDVIWRGEARRWVRGWSLQFPGSISELDTSLTNVKVQYLVGRYGQL